MAHQTLHPFAFEKEGKFSTPTLDYLLSVHAAEKLCAHTPRNTKEQKALDAFKSAVQNLKTHTVYSMTKANDAPEQDVKKSVYNHADGVCVYHATRKECYVVVQPSTFQDIFYPNHNLDNGVTPDPKSWGWDAVLSLRPHKKVLEDLATELDISLNTTVFQRTANLNSLIEKGGAVVRLPDSVVDMGRASGFVVYVKRGYMDPKFKVSTIEKAWVFGSERLAQMAINRYNWKGGVIVEVEVSLKRVVGAAPNGQLNEALAALQKERMQEALKNMEIDVLRERLAELESHSESVVSPTQKRRM